MVSSPELDLDAADAVIRAVRWCFSTVACRIRNKPVNRDVNALYNIYTVFTHYMKAFVENGSVDLVRDRHPAFRRRGQR